MASPQHPWTGGFFWFVPLFTSPIFLIEVLLCFAVSGKRAKIAFAIFIAVIMTETVLMSHPGSSNHAIWSTPHGYILHESLRPRPMLPNTAVIRVKAMGLNPVDYKVMEKLQMVPFLRWFMFQSPGFDAAGVVVELGPGCTSVKTGDEVFGPAMGALQQYALVICTRMVHLPKGVSFVQGAAAVTPAFTAVVGLSSKLKEKDSLVIVGASGGCGQVAIQYAKQRKAGKIYCIASGKNKDLVMAKGCDAFYDYTTADFQTRIVSELKGKIDLVFDGVTDIWPVPSPYIELLMPVLKANGNYVCLNPSFEFYKDRRWSTFTAAFPSEEDVEYVKTHPELLTSVDVAVKMEGLNVLNVQKAYAMLKTHRTVGRIILTIGEQAAK